MEQGKIPVDLGLFQESVRHELMKLAKSVDDVLWYHKLGDMAVIDKVQLVGPPPQNQLAQSPQNKGNPLVFSAYTFVPKNAQEGKKYPLVVYVHGGVHANFGSSACHIVRELLEQGYLVIAPEYRGSTGYGQMFWKLIDYGGLETEDVFCARNWMVETNELVDPDRVGIIGWSHGGMISLFNIFNHPESYQVAYAGVPVSDLVARMGYKVPEYQQLFSADYHIGRSAAEDPWEYRKRSPAWHAEKLNTPLLIHTNTSDEDVNSLEVEHLINALKAHGKQFSYKIYEAEPGGHVFNRVDTTAARQSRKEIYLFLAEYLSPPSPPTA